MHGHECVTKTVICLLYEALRLIYVDVCWLDIVTDKLELGPLNIFKVIYVVGTGTTILYSYLHIHIAWVLLTLALSLTTLKVDQDTILNNYIINYRPKGYRYVYYRLKGSWLDLTGVVLPCMTLLAYGFYNENQVMYTRWRPSTWKYIIKRRILEV